MITRKGAINLEKFNAHVSSLQDDGWTILKGMIPEHVIPTLKDEVLAVVRRERQESPIPKIDYLNGLINHCQTFAAYLTHPRFLEVLGTSLGECFRVSFTMGIATWPGSQRGPLHADWPFNQMNAGRIAAPYPDILLHLTSLWLLTEFTESNGTIIVPKSHRFPTNPSAGGPAAMMQLHPDEIIVSAPAGSVLLFDSRLWHAPAPNRTTRPRVAIGVRFAPWWLDLSVLRSGAAERRRMLTATGRDENLVPLLPPHVYSSLPPKAATLFQHWVCQR